jgi:hypothetical protein
MVQVFCNLGEKQMKREKTGIGWHPAMISERSIHIVKPILILQANHRSTLIKSKLH